MGPLGAPRACQPPGTRARRRHALEGGKWECGVGEPGQFGTPEDSGRPAPGAPGLLSLALPFSGARLASRKGRTLRALPTI